LVTLPESVVGQVVAGTLDEGEAVAKRLRDAGVRARITPFEGGFSDFVHARAMRALFD
jgi:hypothetical protein